VAVSGVVCLCALCAQCVLLLFVYLPTCACGLGWACEYSLDDHRHSHRHTDTQTPTHLLKVLNLRRLSSCRTTSMSFLQASCS
jgi:hypothetical protein